MHEDQHATPKNAAVGPAKSHNKPIKTGAMTLPMREKKLNRPILAGSPPVTCAIIVCAPIHVILLAKPIIICRTTITGSHGKKG